MSKQQNQIGIVNKQKREGKPGSGTTSHKKDPSGEYRRQGTMGGVGKWKKEEVKKGPETGSAATQPQKTESKERRSITKRSAAHTRMKNVTGGTLTQKVAAKGRYRGKGVVDKRP